MFKLFHSIFFFFWLLVVFISFEFSTLKRLAMRVDFLHGPVSFSIGFVCVCCCCRLWYNSLLLFLFQKVDPPTREPGEREKSWPRWCWSLWLIFFFLPEWEMYYNKRRRYRKEKPKSRKSSHFLLLSCCTGPTDFKTKKKCFPFLSGQIYFRYWKTKKK